MLAYIHAITIHGDNGTGGNASNGGNTVSYCTNDKARHQGPGLALSPARLQCVRAYVTCLEVQKQKLGITNGNCDRVDGGGSEGGEGVGVGNGVRVSGGGSPVVMIQQLCTLSQRLPVCLWRTDLLGSE